MSSAGPDEGHQLGAVVGRCPYCSATRRLSRAPGRFPSPRPIRRCQQPGHSCDCRRPPRVPPSEATTRDAREVGYVLQLGVTLAE